MRDEYPTEQELKTIKEWDFKEKGIKEFLEYLESLWHWDDYFILKGKKVLRLELHTGGWSGNEDLIETLMGNFMFWNLYWEKSYRGGHFYFRIKMKIGK